MKRATPVQMRQSLEIVEQLKKAGIRFVAIPVKTEEEFADKIKELYMELGVIARLAGKDGLSGTEKILSNIPDKPDKEMLKYIDKVWENIP